MLVRNAETAIIIIIININYICSICLLLVTINISLGLARCGLGLAGLVLCCETRSCRTSRHNDIEGHNNF